MPFLPVWLSTLLAMTVSWAPCRSACNADDYYPDIGTLKATMTVYEQAHQLALVHCRWRYLKTASDIAAHLQQFFLEVARLQQLCNVHLPQRVQRLIELIPAAQMQSVKPLEPNVTQSIEYTRLASDHIWLTAAGPLAVQPAAWALHGPELPAGNAWLCVSSVSALP